MLKIMWKRGEIAPEEQFLLLSTIFCYLMLDFYVKTRIRFSLRDKRLFEITEVEIMRVDRIYTCSQHTGTISRGMTALSCFPAFFTLGNNFCDFLRVVVPGQRSSLKKLRGIFLQERTCSKADIMLAHKNKK